MLEPCGIYIPTCGSEKALWKRVLRRFVVTNWQSGKLITCCRTVSLEQSWCQFCRYWRHGRLSKSQPLVAAMTSWQLAVPLFMTNLASKWLRFWCYQLHFHWWLPSVYLQDFLALPGPFRLKTSRDLTWFIHPSLLVTCPCHLSLPRNVRW